MVGVECDKLERISVATPGAHVVVWPVAVVVVHFGEHVLGKTVDVEFALNLFVLCVVFASKVCARNSICELLVVFCRGSVCSASFVARTGNLDHVDRLGIDAVVCLDKVSVQAFAHIVNAEVFAIVEYDNLAAALIIHIGAFHEGCHHGIANIVRPKTVTVVAQIETLEFLGIRASFKQRIFDGLVAVSIVIHLDGDTLLGLVAAVITDN